MTRTNIVIDDELIARAMIMTGIKTKREVVEHALKTLVELEDAYEGILRLRGKFRWEGNLDEMRRDRE